MKHISPSARILGLVILLQAVMSLLSGAVFLQPLVSNEGIVATMRNIAERPILMRLNILGDTITALGIVALAALLFAGLRKVSFPVAATAFGLYIAEAGLLLLSKAFGYGLLVVSGSSSSVPIGTLLLESMEFAYAMHMLPFCIGAFLFYWLMFRSSFIPRPLSAWGLVTLVPLLVGTVLLFFGISIPFAFYLPYVPFEFVVGFWILFRGHASEPEGS